MRWTLATSSTFNSVQQQGVSPWKCVVMTLSRCGSAAAVRHSRSGRARKRPISSSPRAPDNRCRAPCRRGPGYPAANDRLLDVMRLHRATRGSRGSGSAFQPFHRQRADQSSSSRSASTPVSIRRRHHDWSTHKRPLRQAIAGHIVAARASTSKPLPPWRRCIRPHLAG